MKEISLAIIGSGSTYCPELIDGFLKRRGSLRLRRVAFMDIDEKKRNIVGALCRRMLDAAGAKAETILTADLDEALMGADFVVTQIRVGRLPARHLDESIPLKYGLVGQETTGIGGFFKALRTIPVIAKICERMSEICPNAFLVNFTNPSGIISEFVLNRTKIRSVGLCNCPVNMIDEIRAKYGDVNVGYVGLNHLSWVVSVEKDGKEIIGRVIDDGFSVGAMANIFDDGVPREVVEAARGIPSSYLQYYYRRNAKLAHLKADEKTRAEVCQEIEADMLKLYSDENLREKPALLDKRGGHKYSLAACSLIDSVANDSGDIHVVNLRNKGALPFMESDDVVEIAAKVDAQGAHPLPFKKPCSPHIVAMMRAVKAYEKAAVEAAVSGSDEAALNALLLHPLVGDFDAAKACFAEMKEAHKAHLPQFFGKSLA